MIKRTSINELDTLSILANKLYHDNIEELKTEFIDLLNNKNNLFLLYYYDNLPIGFAHFSLRFDYVEGCTFSPVCYLEGIYIEEKYRHQGFGKQLLEEGIIWAKERNCHELASDCELSNNESKDFHIKMGFKITNKIICFKQNI